MAARRKLCRKIVSLKILSLIESGRKLAGSRQMAKFHLEKYPSGHHPIGKYHKKQWFENSLRTQGAFIDKNALPHRHVTRLMIHMICEYNFIRFITELA